MGHLVVTGMKQSNSYSAGLFVSSIGDNIVIDDIAAGHFTRSGSQIRFAYFNATCAQIGDVAMLDSILVALPSEADAICTGMKHLAILKNDVFRKIKLDGRLCACCCLHRLFALEGNHVRRILERQSLEFYVLHRILRFSLHRNPLMQYRSDAKRCIHILSFTRHIIEIAGFTVQKPLTCHIQRRLVVIHKVAGTFKNLVPRLHAPSFHIDAGRVHLHIFRVLARNVPFVVETKLDVFQFLSGKSFH